ncbi:MAG: hypothetical protein M3Z40_09870 [Bifidobacterium sp.]|nr:hypothetical protein [Bifidobacterium sp.]
MHYIINKSFSSDAQTGPKHIEITATEYHDETFRVFTDHVTGKEVRIPISEIHEFETRP